MILTLRQEKDSTEITKCDATNNITSYLCFVMIVFLTKILFYIVFYYNKTIQQQLFTLIKAFTLSHTVIIMGMNMMRAQTPSRFFIVSVKGKS